METEHLYQELKSLADKLNVVVAEHSFKNAGVAVNSGFCVIKNQPHCIIDRHLKVRDKIDVLAECLCGIPHDHVFVVPAVRDLLNRIARRPEGKVSATGEDDHGHRGVAGN